MIQSTSARLASPAFVEKAPADVVQREKEKYDGLLVNLEKLKKNLEALQ
jgi:valyl-tRNA synthetase